MVNLPVRRAIEKDYNPSVELVELIRNEKLIYFVGTHPLLSLADFRSTIKGDVFADPKICPYPGLRVEFPNQNVCLPLVDQRDSTKELTDPDTGNVLLVVDKGYHKNGAFIRLKQFENDLGKLQIEAMPTFKGFGGYIKDGTGETVVRIKLIDRLISFGPIRIHRLELGQRLLTPDNKTIAEVMKLSYWTSNVTCRFTDPKSIDDEILLLCFGATTAILAGYDFIHRRIY